MSCWRMFGLGLMNIKKGHVILLFVRNRMSFFRYESMNIHVFYKFYDKHM